MAKVKISKDDRAIYELDAIGRAYLEYNDKVGGEPFGECIGMPVFEIDKDYGGIVGLYHECIKQGKTWQELLKTSGRWDEIPTEE
jgi:hypothetical protein